MVHQCSYYHCIIFFPIFFTNFTISSLILCNIANLYCSSYLFSFLFFSPLISHSILVFMYCISVNLSALSGCNPHFRQFTRKNWHFAALNNFSLRTFMPNLATSLILRSLQILSKIQMGVFLISGFLVKFRLNKNCHNSRTTNDIDISKLRS